MFWRIKSLVEKFVEGVKEAVEADIQERMVKEKEMQSTIKEREREVTKRESSWKAELSRREAEIAQQELKLRMEKEDFEKEKSMLTGGGGGGGAAASIQDNHDGALEITFNGDKYRCLRFFKAKK